MTDPANEPAFPSAIIGIQDGIAIRGGGGLTKRELFAAMAMQSLNRINAINGYNTFEERARACVEQADALLAELEKTK